MEKHGVLNKPYEMLREVNKELFNIWSEDIVFNWRWWLSITLSILPWVLWIKFRDKKNIVRLSFAGLVTAMTTNLLDIIGLTLDLWHYDWKIFPMIPAYLPWDFALFPVSTMFLLQVNSKLKILSKALIFAGCSAFIFEPLFYFLGLYHPVHWKSIYSFFIYILLFYFFNYVYNLKMFEKYSSD